MLATVALALVLLTTTIPASSGFGFEPAAVSTASSSTITGATTLYLHSEPTGVGNFDAEADGATMDQTPPADDRPAFYHSQGSDDLAERVLNDSFAPDQADARWTWSPLSDYDFENVTVTVRFWALAPAGALDCGGWGVELSNGTETVAKRSTGSGFEPDHRGGVSEFVKTFEGVNASGDELNLEIVPQFIDCGYANAIVYDAESFASRIEIRPADHDPQPVTGDRVLYFQSEATKVGNADFLAAASTMSEDEPSGSVPAVWHSAGFPDRPLGDAETPADAYWTYRPDGGFSFQEKDLVVRFWASAVGQAIFSGTTWHAELYVDGSQVAASGQTEFPPAVSSTPRQYNISFQNLTLEGEELVIQIHPQFINTEWANAIYYNATGFQSHLQIGVGADETPPSTPTDLTATNVASTAITIEWNAATDNSGIDHYNIYRATGTDALTKVAEANGTEYTDESLSPSTTYRYAVSAVDLAGNEGQMSDPIEVTTDPPDETPPTISTGPFDVSATGATLAWTTDENATGQLRIGETLSEARTFTTPLGTEHRVTVPSLEPSTTYAVEINATDRSGNTASVETSIDTGTTQVRWLHNTGGGVPGHEFNNEFNTTGDDDGSGWNEIGAALNTATTHTGDVLPAFLATEDVYPAEAPLSPSVTIDDTEEIEGTIYVNMGTLTTAAGAGVARFNLSLYANGGQLLGAGSTSHVVTPGGYVPLEFSFPARLDTVEAGTLRAEFRPEAAMNTYVIGYEGDHASHVSIPVEPTLPLRVDGSVVDDDVLEDRPITFEADVTGGTGSVNVAWSFDDGGSATGTTVDHTFDEPGIHTVTVTATDENGATDTDTLEVQVLQRDFGNNSRTVVAVIDTGVNPYHPVYQRPGADMPLDTFEDATDGDEAKPTVFDLADSGDYDQRVAADAAEWDALDRGELVWFEDTNVLGISFHNTSRSSAIGDRQLLDEDGHGTATSSTVLAQDPDTVVVMVQPTIVESAAGTALSGLGGAINWTIEQPWIDVVSVSAGALANAPLGGLSVPRMTQQAYEDGKVVVMSAGNDPSPTPSDSNDGPPWVWSVTGSEADGEGKAAMSSNIYPDYIAPFTVEAAEAGTAQDNHSSISGTSFSAPVVSGTVAGIVDDLRAQAGHTGGITAAELAPGYTNEDVRAALNKTAILPTWDGYLAGTAGLGNHAHPPGAPYLTAQWGFVDQRIVDDAVANLTAGTLNATNKPAASVYKETTYQSRVQYWDAQERNPRANPDGFLDDVSVPGLERNVVEIDTVETPHPYPNDANLTYEVHVDGADALSLHFRNFSIETGYDGVWLEQPDGTPIARLSQEGGAEFWSPYVPGDTVVVRLDSDSFVNRYGFEIDAVDAPGAE